MSYPSTTRTPRQARPASYSSAGPSSLRSRPDSLDLPPPPAYEEAHRAGGDESHHAWIDEVIASPKSSSKRRHDQDRSADSVNTPGGKRRPRVKITPQAVRRRKKVNITRFEPIVIYSIEQQGESPTRAVPVNHLVETAEEHGTIPPERDRDRGETAVDEETTHIDHVSLRLDHLADIVRRLIHEGNHALSQPSPLVLGEREWEDVGPG